MKKKQKGIREPLKDLPPGGQDPETDRPASPVDVEQGVGVPFLEGLSDFNVGAFLLRTILK
ncbi:MAG: hypothetical protein IPP35_02220 [Elusimicrobia bacterium]|nr:hypothetical protein [Elusimicrobiota bacterium]